MVSLLRNIYISLYHLNRPQCKPLFIMIILHKTVRYSTEAEDTGCVYALFVLTDFTYIL